MVRSKSIILKEVERLAEGPGQRAHRRVGTMIRDKYRIDAFIATGSMANVYAATHRNGSRVALKILHSELARDPSFAERFRREGYFANAIGHPGIVRAIDDDLTEDGCAFLVMELMEGENLEERRARLGGKIPLDEVLQIGDAILDMLAAAHAHEVLHRDLKPANVFITRKNEVKLLDFGVARFNDGRSSSDMTAVGMVLGTPAFMPPEQALGRREEVDARSDIWGVGATLFTVITGQAVHVGGDAKTKLIATARTAARPMLEVAPTTPRAVASVIDRALAFDRHERWADANAMREALRLARMSPDEDAVTAPGLAGDSRLLPTRRTPEEEPTLAGRVLPPLAKSGGDAFDDRTMPRVSLLSNALDPTIRSPTSDGVVTSAPPVTLRDAPPAMAMSEGPTFSLRNAVAPQEIEPARARTSEATAPITHRMPHTRSDPPSPERPKDPPATLDTAAIFRAALANAALAGGSTDATSPRFDPVLAAMQAGPRPAAGAPVDNPVLGFPPGPSPSTRTAPGIGTSQLDVRPPHEAHVPTHPHAAHPYAAPSYPAPAASSSPGPSYPAPGPAPGLAPGPGPGLAPGPGPGPGPGPAPTPAPAAPSYPAPAVAVTETAGLSHSPRGGQPSLTPEGPGPLLSTIVAKNSSRVLRVLALIAIGLFAGVATYVVVVRRRDPTPRHAANATTVADASVPFPAPSESARPAEPATSASGALAPTASAPVPPPTPSSVATTSRPPPKKRTRPRVKPLAGPSTKATATAAPTAEPTAEPPNANPVPTSAPAPTPNDALPTKAPD